MCVCAASTERDKFICTDVFCNASINRTTAINRTKIERTFSGTIKFSKHKLADYIFMMNIIDKSR